MKLWNLSDLQSTLKARPEIKGWVIEREDARRRERYFLKDGGIATDQDRAVHQQTTSVRIMVRIPGKSDRQGEVSKRLAADQDLSPQIDSAIESALKTDHQAWDLPREIPRDKPELKTCDPSLAEDLEGALESTSAEIAQAVAEIEKEKQGVAFSSAELFCSVHDKQYIWSNGLSHRSSQSRIYVESAFASLSGSKDEYLHTRWGVSRADLPIKKLLNTAAERAQFTREVVKPKPGHYWVVVDAEVLSTIFHGLLSHLSGGNAYHGLPHTDVGGELIPGARAGESDLMTWKLDPSLDFGPDSGVFSDQGIIQRPLQVVKANRVEAQLLDQQFATYLGKGATTARGNLVVEPGSKTYAELLKAAPQVLEILQFSGLFSDGNSGTFSSEIRLARLHDRETGTSTLIKGGSLSGSMKENFTRARLSRETTGYAYFASTGMGGSSVHGTGYVGPAYALLNDVSIAG